MKYLRSKYQDMTYFYWWNIIMNVEFAHNLLETKYLAN
jgi:hypothetical protein